MYRKYKYIIRHRNDKLYDINSAGFWSMFLLWHKKTINESIKDIEKHLNIQIKQVSNDGIKDKELYEKVNKYADTIYKEKNGKNSIKKN
jgi:hypothetical protein